LAASPALICRFTGRIIYSTVSIMKTYLCFAAAVALGLSGLSVQGARTAEPSKSVLEPATNSVVGLQAAQVLTTITGVAISPLLGVSAVGAWKYYRTPPANRGSLPWFGRPWFWVPGLVLVALVFLKDALGTAMPASLKKPFDVMEAFENKISALIAAGLFVPLVVSVFGSSSDSAAIFQGSGLAMIESSAWLNLLTVPVAIVAFFMVWLVSNVINVLILVSPFGAVDAVLKLARLLVLSALTAVAFIDPVIGGLLSLVVIFICYLLSGWAFRMTIFGTVFGWDILTLRHRRFQPDAKANWVFLARTVEQAPVRTFGKLHRNEQGQLALSYRPWLMLPSRVLILPAGQYAIERGLVFPELLQMDGRFARSMCLLPPRYLSHEEEVARIYGLSEVQEVPVLRGFKAAWRWLKQRMGFGNKPAIATAPAPAATSS
jgi:hypothetical protein